MTLTITPLTSGRMRNSRDPIDGTFAPRCQTQWILSLDEDGTADVYSRDYYGGDGTPMDEWHNRTLTWGFGLRGDLSVIDRDALADDLQPGGRLHTLLARVHAGHSVDWDGSNHVGDLTDDASTASEQIDRLLSSDDYCDKDAPEVWDAIDWLTALGSTPAVLADLGLTVTATDDEIAAAATLADKWAASDDCELIDTADAIKTLIDEIKAKMADDDDDEDGETVS